MVKNYLKIAFRYITKSKGYTAINLTGLSLGLTAGIMIMLYVVDELSFDNFHSRRNRIYRVETQFVNNGDNDTQNNETNAWGVGNLLREYPEVEAVLYTRGESGLMVNHENRFISQKMYYVSPEFFSIFSFNLRKGNAATALKEPYSIVITEDMEKKYFDGKDALNKMLTLGDSMQFVVTGVLENFPSNSHIQADILISFATYTTVIAPDFSYDDGWGNINMRNYVLLRDGANAGSFFEKAKPLYEQYASEMLRSWGTTANVRFTPLPELYLHANSNGMGPLGSINRIYLVSGIALFVLLLACINFVNLTTARSFYRAKEVGLRKVVGSSRASLIRQFLSESFLLTLFGLFVALCLIGVLLPMFNSLLEKQYTLLNLLQPQILLGMFILLVAVTVLSGYYPAIVMSGMKPAEVLKGKMQNSVRGVQLRRSLVVLQFVISVSLVLGTLIVIDQLNFMQGQALGFDKDQILIVRADRVRSPDPLAFETFRNEMKTLASVQDVTYTNSIPGQPGWIGQVAYPDGVSGDAAVSVEYMAIDDRYLSTLGIELVAGNGFDKDHAIDLDKGLVLNETAVQMFGWRSPKDAIGKKITSPSGHPEGEVIGVVKDYHQFGLQQSIGPKAMDYNQRYAYLYAIKFNGNPQNILSSAEATWKKIFPGYDYRYFFLDEHFEKQYVSEQKTATVFGLFAFIAILIAAIGLLGLVSFMVVTRTKEIGIRKVLGASVMSITQLLSTEFLVLVMLGNLIAFPLVWFIAQRWLEGFANRVTISPWLFIAAACIAISVSLLTVSMQTIRAALTDPVDSLRSE